MAARDIKIKLIGVQRPAGEISEPEVLELETTGVFYEKDGVCYIKYDEFIEEAEPPVKNLLRFDEHMLQVTKRGSVNTEMLFDQKKPSLVYYATPVGPICMNICTEAYRMDKAEQGINIDVRYCIDFNNDYITNCSLNVTADYVNANA